MAENIPATLVPLAVPVASLNHYGNNPRQGDVETIKKSLAKNGQYRPIVVNKPNNEVLAGNHTLKAARELGWERIAATFVEVDEVTAKRIVLIDNRANDIAGYDNKALADLLRSLPDLEGTGYDTAALEAVLAELDDDPADGNADPEDAPSVEDSPTRTSMGEVWVLGKHRLICGDSTKTTTLQKLMAGAEADCIVTDPPYNVAYEGGTADKLTLGNDDMDSASFRAFLQDAYHAMAAVTRDGGPIYVWHSDAEGIAFRETMMAAGFAHKQTLIWVKSSLVLGRQDYQWKHEPCLYGWKEGAAHRWFGAYDKTTVIDELRPAYKQMTKGELIDRIYELERQVPETVIYEDKPKRNGEHPTMKPVKLLIPLIQNSTVQGNTVLDPFGGSGSTLIACEQLGRAARLVEYDPRYCDVILKRWEDFTGKQAYREGDEPPPENEQGDFEDDLSAMLQETP